MQHLVQLQFQQLQLSHSLQPGPLLHQPAAAAAAAAANIDRAARLSTHSTPQSRPVDMDIRWDRDAAGVTAGERPAIYVSTLQGAPSQASAAAPSAATSAAQVPAETYSSAAAPDPDRSLSLFNNAHVCVCVSLSVSVCMCPCLPASMCVRVRASEHRHIHYVATGLSGRLSIWWMRKSELYLGRSLLHPLPPPHATPQRPRLPARPRFGLR